MHLSNCKIPDLADPPVLTVSLGGNRFFIGFIPMPQLKTLTSDFPENPTDPDADLSEFRSAWVNLMFAALADRDNQTIPNNLTGIARLIDLSFSLPFPELAQAAIDVTHFCNHVAVFGLPAPNAAN